MSDDPRKRVDNAAIDGAAPPTDDERTPLTHDSHLDAETLSAWLDTPEDFSAADRQTIETHLSGCADCARIAAELTAIVGALQSLAFVDPRRSFALTPEQAGQRAPAPARPNLRLLEEPALPYERRRAGETRRPAPLYEPVPWHERPMRALRWATAVAAILFVFVISADLLGNPGTYGDGDDDDAAVFSDMPQPTTAAGAAPESAGAAAATESGGDQEMTTLQGPAEATEDAARNAEGTTQPAAGSGPAEPTATAAAAAAAEPTPASESPPAGDDAQPTGDAADTDMAMSATVEEEASDGSGEALDQQYGAEDAAQETSDGRSTWRLIEFGLAMIIIWLLAAMIALPRLRRRS